MSKKLISIFILFFLLVVILLMVEKYSKTTPLAGMKQPYLNTTPVNTATTLSLIPSQLIVNPGKPTSITIFAHSEMTSPTLIQFEISYDPTILTNMTVSSGDFFINPNVLLQNINANTGRISYAIERLPDQTNDKREGAVAILNFIPNPNLVKNQTNISFLPKTIVRGKSEENILKQTQNATILIQASTSAILR